MLTKRLSVEALNQYVDNIESTRDMLKRRGLDGVIATALAFKYDTYYLGAANRKLVAKVISERVTVQ